jgi:predicted dehydrogenase
MDSNLKKVLLIGAGQIGSRHLQGIVKSAILIEIFVYDPSDISLKMSKERSNEIKHLHDIHFINDWSLLPKDFDLILISTSANIREKIISDLIITKNVKNLILEKVLFQDINSYARIYDLKNNKGWNIWVNHPRRLYKSYQYLKNKLLIKENISFKVEGTNWGLACNSLHFIDLFIYLTNSKLLEIELHNAVQIESKREGFIEFNGYLEGKLTNNNNFSISSMPGERTPNVILIETKDIIYKIDEGEQIIYELEKDTRIILDKYEFKIEPQSYLTTSLIEDILLNENCNLPTYEDSMKPHIFFIDELLKKYNNLNSFNSKILPIT